MKNTLLALMCMAALALHATGRGAFPEKKILTTMYDTEVLKDKLCAPQAFHSIPKAGSSYWKDSIPEAMKRSYIRKAAKYLNQSWASLPAMAFSQFRTDGNRVHFEQLSFQKREQLATLVLGEIMENQGRFLPDIINGLWSICEETWWGIPAHYGPKLPIPEDQSVDLFNAETAGMMAWTNYMLREKLDAFSPLISRRIDAEIDRRMLKPAMAHNDWWKTAGMNWNPWICSNWLGCVLLSETDRERQLAGVQAILQCLDHFIDAYPNDGGCDEGPGYWDRAAASLCENLILLSQSTGGMIDLSAVPKIQNMGTFLYKTYIGNGYAANFADASNQAVTDLNSIYPFARYIHDPVMQGYAAFLAKEKEFFSDPGKLYAHCGNYPSVARELRLLTALNTLSQEKPQEALVSGAWLPDLQVVTARSRPNSVQGLYLAVKGGHNGESHNHNDVGNFVVYHNGEPLLIDAGVGTYTAQTFSGGRYAIWTMQSGYHNLPKINGTDQKEGKDFKARNVQYRENSKEVRFSLDIAGAYPAEAKVDTWVRSFRFERNKQIEITEAYKLKACTAPTEIMLLSCAEPTLTEKGILLTGKGGTSHISYGSGLLPTVEEIEITDPRLHKNWGDRIWRIRLLIDNSSTSGHIKYVIR